MTPRTLPWVQEIRLNGEGPDRLMLLAGFGSGPETLRELGTYVRETCAATVLLVALAGHTGATAFRRSRAWQYLQEAERRFLEFWGERGTPLHLGGYSTGALVALLIAARHPDKVTGLVLVSPALRLARPGKQLVGYAVGSIYYLLLPGALLVALLGVAWHGRRRGWQPTRDVRRLLATLTVFATATLGLRRLTVPVEPGGPLLRDGEEVLPPHFTRASLVAGSTLVSLQLAATWRLARLAVPVCIVFGERDETVDVRFGTLRASRYRRAELHVVPDAPHRVVTYAECLVAVSEFIGRTGAPQR